MQSIASTYDGVAHSALESRQSCLVEVRQTQLFMLVESGAGMWGGLSGCGEVFGGKQRGWLARLEHLSEESES